MYTICIYNMQRMKVQPRRVEIDLTGRIVDNQFGIGGRIHNTQIEGRIPISRKRKVRHTGENIMVDGIDQFLVGKIRGIKLLYGKMRGSAIAPQTKSRIEAGITKLEDDVQNSEYGDGYTTWRANWGGNKTRNLDTIENIQQLSNNELAAVYVILDRLDLPPAQYKAFRQVVKRRGLNDFIKYLE